MSKQYNLSLLKAPSGLYVFVGSVPRDLAIRHANGSRLTDAEFTEYSQSSNPTMVQRRCKYVNLVFNSRGEALTFAREYIDALEQSEEYGCFDGFGRRDQANTRDFFNRPEIKSIVRLLERETENE